MHLRALKKILPRNGMIRIHYWFSMSCSPRIHYWYSSRHVIHFSLIWCHCITYICFNGTSKIRWDAWPYCSFHDVISHILLRYVIVTSSIFIIHCFCLFLLNALFILWIYNCVMIAFKISNYARKKMKRINLR